MSEIFEVSEEWVLSEEWVRHSIDMNVTVMVRTTLPVR
jgi:hypothetical protein